MAVEFFVPCVPPTALHHSKKIVNRGRFKALADTPELQNTKAFLAASFREHAPEAPIPGPVRLEIELTWPWRAGDSKKKRALGRIPSQVKPDCSNCAKTIEDTLARLLFVENDSHVAELIVRKFIGDKPGIRVWITTLQEATQ